MTHHIHHCQCKEKIAFGFWDLLIICPLLVSAGFVWCRNYVCWVQENVNITCMWLNTDITFRFCFLSSGSSSKLCLFRTDITPIISRSIPQDCLEISLYCISKTAAFIYFPLRFQNITIDGIASYTDFEQLFFSIYV